MRALARLAFLIFVTSPLAAALAAGCGSTPSGTTGGQTGSGGRGGNASSSTGGNTSSSGTAGKGGNTSSSGTASTSSGTAGNTGTGGMPPGCFPLGAVCATGSDCCSSTCMNGVCNPTPCTSDMAACGSSADCCSGNCMNGTCAPLSNTCKTLGNACGNGNECCSLYCTNGVCGQPSFCVQNGDACTKSTDCCGGICTIAAGMTKGTCSSPPTGAANCGLVDGELCGGTTADGGAAMADGGIPSCGGDCCSRLCAPYGPTGVLVCQPASGCHVVGDLCTKDSDCCGSAGLPGGSGTPVTCNIVAPNTVGVCRNPQGCKPDGDVCKLSTMSCNASCDCCSGNCQNQDTCHLDSVGVPRCSGATCVPAGGSCASSANCCNGLPCVPNPVDGGTPPYICYQSSCVPECGPCAINADCCVGESCIVAPGSTMGFCGPCNPPPDGGTPDSGTPDSGTPDSGTPDSGTPDSGTPDSGTPDSGTPDSGVCALYGQQCTVDGDCCNMVPCSGPNGPCQTGQTGCTCHYVIK